MIRDELLSKSTEKKTKALETDKLDSCEGIQYKPLCPEDIASMTSSRGSLSRSFSVCDLVAKHKHDLHVRAYMDYYGGYSEHGRQTVFGLDATGRHNIKVTTIKTPVDIDPITHKKCDSFVFNNTVNTSKSDFMVIGGPGWLQKKYLPQSRKTYGWTMIESLEFNEDCTEWLKNVDCLLCPTDTDVRRAKNAGVENYVKMHLGYDEKLYHENIKPIDIHGLDGRYVFGVLGSWNKRKDVRSIIRAYCEAFTSVDNVTLLMVSKYGTRPFGELKEDKERWTIKYEFDKIIEEVGKDNLPHIALIDIPVHETMLPHIMKRFDCLVGFSMGESTWLPGLQAMNMKIPVIQLASRCSGFMEYLNKDNSFLCENVNYIEADEELYVGTSDYYKDQVFAQGDWKELAGTMLDVTYMNGCPEMDKTLDNAKESVRNWTWDISAKCLSSFLVV